MRLARSSDIVVIGCVLTAVAAESAMLVGGDHVIGLAGLALALLATAAWALMAFDPRVEQRPRLVIVAIAVAFTVAVVVPPRGSQDLWSYVMYGRTVAVHHTSPYVHSPSEFPRDPFAARVAAGWRHSKSVYGPLFTAGSAAVVRITGDSALRARLAFQGSAAIGMLAALGLVWRAKRSVRALAFVGLHPAVVTGVVNGGHNDALVGVTVLAGALFAGRRQWRRAGFVLALGVLVKASAGLGLLAVFVWGWRRDRRGAAQLALTAAITTAVAYVPAGLTAVRAITRAGNGNTRASPWDPVSSLLHPPTAFMVLAALVLAAACAWWWRASPRSDTTTLATMAAFLVGGVYVLPWYSGWALPTAALERRSGLAVLVAAHAAFLVAVYEFETPAHVRVTGAWAVVRDVFVQGGAWIAVAALVVLLLHARRRDDRAATRRSAPAGANRA